MQEQAETKMQQWGQQESHVADYKMSVNQLHCVVCRDWLLPGLHQSPVLASLLKHWRELWKSWRQSGEGKEEWKKTERIMTRNLGSSA